MNNGTRTSPPTSCPECGYTLVRMTITESTVPVEVLTFCGGCGVQVLDDGTVGASSQAVWAEHYEGGILRFPTVEIGAEDGE